MTFLEIDCLQKFLVLQELCCHFVKNDLNMKTFSRLDSRNHVLFYIEIALYFVVIFGHIYIAPFTKVRLSFHKRSAISLLCFLIYPLETHAKYL